MMNKEEIKIKYLIGSFRDELDFPIDEDVLYLMKHWYHNEGGKEHIRYRGIPDENKVVFTNHAAKEKLGIDDQSLADIFLNLISDKKIEINKVTKFTTYYTII